MKLTINNQFGMRVRFLREQRKLTQESLALDVGVSKNYICDIECGRRNPTLKIINKIAKGLRVSISELMQGIGDKNNY